MTDEANDAMYTRRKCRTTFVGIVTDLNGVLLPFKSIITILIVLNVFFDRYIIEISIYVFASLCGVNNRPQTSDEIATRKLRCY